MIYRFFLLTLISLFLPLLLQIWKFRWFLSLNREFIYILELIYNSFQSFSIIIYLPHNLTIFSGIDTLQTSFSYQPALFRFAVKIVPNSE